MVTVSQYSKFISYFSIVIYDYDLYTSLQLFKIVKPWLILHFHDIVLSTNRLVTFLYNVYLFKCQSNKNYFCKKIGAQKIDFK